MGRQLWDERRQQRVEVAEGMLVGGCAEEGCGVGCGESGDGAAVGNIRPGKWALVHVVVAVSDVLWVGGWRDEEAT